MRWSLVVLVACGGSSTTAAQPEGGSRTSDGSVQPEAGTSGEGGTTIVDGGKDADPPNDPKCPPTFEAPPGNCQVGLSCSYPQGRCKCLDYCGGAQPPPDHDFSHWACTPRVDNGCPEQVPTQGKSCTVPVTCNYGDCCFQSAKCSGGKWSVGPLQCPP